MRRRPRRGAFDLQFVDAWQPYSKAATSAGPFAFGGDFTSVSVDEAASNREPNAEPSQLPLDALRTLREEIEKSRHQFGRDAHSRVFDGHFHDVFSRGRKHADLPARLGV